MLEKRRADRRVIGFALLASAVVLVGVGLAVASGILDLPPAARIIVTIGCCGAAFVDAILAAKFLWSAGQ